MYVFIILLFTAISGSVKSDKPENEKFDDEIKDNSVFDKILSINQKAARSRSGENQPKLVQGDIVETPWVKQMMAGGMSRGAAIGNEKQLWPNVNGKRVIPYVINSAIRGSAGLIMGATREWMNKVPCLQFVQRTNQRDYLHFYPGSGCSSHVGRRGYRQDVSLAGGCMRHGIIVHEIGHALGFWHEQSRLDRDRYITIHWENIIPNMKFNFQTVQGSVVNDVGYDYESIMHYGPYAFAVRRGLVTISTRDGSNKIGQRQGLSAKDVEQARKLYKCSGGTTGGGTTGGGTTGGGTTGGGTTGGGNTGCSNKNTECESWYTRGYCSSRSTYRDYMMTDCKKACCVNNHARCVEWANRGECQKNPNYMMWHCRGACYKCNC